MWELKIHIKPPHQGAGDNVIMTVKDRLLSFLRAEGINNSEFARRMGVSVAYLGAMRKSMPEEKVAKLMQEFPKLNRDWLLYGEGEMLLPHDNAPKVATVERPGMEDYMVPLLPVEAFACNLQVWSEGILPDECRRVLAPLKGAEMAIQVTGDSMEPNIPNGAMLFIKRINDRAFIPWGHPMVIDTENGVLVKVVQPSAEGSSYIEAQSYNDKYAPIQIPKDCLYGLYRVMAVLTTMCTL